MLVKSFRGCDPADIRISNLVLLGNMYSPLVLAFLVHALEPAVGVLDIFGFRCCFFTENFWGPGGGAT